MSQSRKVAVFDIDGTLFRWQLYYAVVLSLHEKGFFPANTATQISLALKGWEARSHSFREFEDTAITALTELLPSLKVDDFNSIVQEVIHTSSHKTYAFTRKLAEDLKNQGYLLLAVSGSQQEIAWPFVQLYGFDDCIGWIYEKKGGYFTGKTLRNTIHDKAAIVRDYVNKHNLSLSGSIAIGDSKSDIAMLRLVDQPIAFNPSEELLDEALANGWRVVVERKNIAYNLTRNSDGNTVLATADRF